MKQGLPLNRASESASPASTGPSDRPLVLVVDDDAAVRIAIEELLCSVGIDTAGFASPRALFKAGLPDRPGCLVLDVRMPGSTGLDLQQHFTANAHAKPIVFLTGHGDIPMTVQAMKAGAVDFLIKPVRNQALLDAATAGIERDIELRAEAQIVGRQMDPYATPTTREREIPGYMAQGRLNKQIACDLGISEVTVKFHRGSVRRRMAFDTVGELISVWNMLPPDLRYARN